MSHLPISFTRVLAFALILTLILLPSTAQCAASADSVYGTWDLTHVRTDPRNLGLYDTFTLLSDGTYTRTSAGSAATGRWSISGNVLLLTSGTGSETFTLKSNMLIQQQDGSVSYFTSKTASADDVTGTWTFTDSLTPLSLWQIAPQSFHFDRNGLCTVKEGNVTYRASWSLLDNIITIEDAPLLTVSAGCLLRERPLMVIGGSGLSDGMLYLTFHKRQDPQVKGDADGSGTADLNDLLLILQHCAGWPVTLNDELSDLDEDGSCTISDARLLLESLAP